MDNLAADLTDGTSLDDVHPSEVCTPGPEGPEWVWAKVAPEDLAGMRVREVRSGLPAVPPHEDRNLGDDLRQVVAEAVRSAITNRGPGPSVAKASDTTDLPQEAVHIREFGRRYGYSERTVFNFIDVGLPCIGRGRLRRIPLKEGGEWLRMHLAEAAADPMDAAVDADLRGRKGT